MYLMKNLPLEKYVALMRQCACLIGNSSSGVREGAFIGVPCVNIGTRQNGRMRGKNLVDVGENPNEIVSAVRGQIRHGRYKRECLYGDGKAGSRIARILAEIKSINIQKRIIY